MMVRIARHTTASMGIPVIGVIMTSEILSAREGFVSLSWTTSETMLSASAYLSEAMVTPICSPWPSL